MATVKELQAALLVLQEVFGDAEIVVKEDDHGGH